VGSSLRNNMNTCVCVCVCVRGVGWKATSHVLVRGFWNYSCSLKSLHSFSFPLSIVCSLYCGRTDVSIEWEIRHML
jgi:hypothetical protein